MTSILIILVLLIAVIVYDMATGNVERALEFLRKKFDCIKKCLL